MNVVIVNVTSEVMLVSVVSVVIVTSFMSEVVVGSMVGNGFGIVVGNVIGSVIGNPVSNVVGVSYRCFKCAPGYRGPSPHSTGSRSHACDCRRSGSTTDTESGYALR